MYASGRPPTPPPPPPASPPPLSPGAGDHLASTSPTTAAASNDPDGHAKKGGGDTGHATADSPLPASDGHTGPAPAAPHLRSWITTAPFDPELSAAPSSAELAASDAAALAATLSDADAATVSPDAEGCVFASLAASEMSDDLSGADTEAVTSDTECRVFVASGRKSRATRLTDDGSRQVAHARRIDFCDPRLALGDDSALGIRGVLSSDSLDFDPDSPRILSLLGGIPSLKRRRGLAAGSYSMEFTVDGWRLVTSPRHHKWAGANEGSPNCIVLHRRVDATHLIDDGSPPTAAAPGGPELRPRETPAPVHTGFTFEYMLLVQIAPIADGEPIRLSYGGGYLRNYTVPPLPAGFTQTLSATAEATLADSAERLARQWGLDLAAIAIAYGCPWHCPDALKLHNRLRRFQPSDTAPAARAAPATPTPPAASPSPFGDSDDDLDFDSAELPDLIDDSVNDPVDLPFQPLKPTQRRHACARFIYYFWRTLVCCHIPVKDRASIILPPRAGRTRLLARARVISLYPVVSAKARRADPTLVARPGRDGRACQSGPPLPFYRPVRRTVCCYGSAYAVTGRGRLARAEDFANQRLLSQDVGSLHDRFGRCILQRLCSAPLCVDVPFCGGGGTSLGVDLSGVTPVNSDHIDQPDVRAQFGEENFAVCDALDFDLAVARARRPGMLFVFPSPSCFHATRLSFQGGRCSESALLLHVCNHGDRIQALTGVPYAVETVRGGSCLLNPDRYSVCRAMDHGSHSEDAHPIVTPPGFRLRTDSALTVPGRYLRNFSCSGPNCTFGKVDPFQRPLGRPCCSWAQAQKEIVHGRRPAAGRNVRRVIDRVGFTPGYSITWSNLALALPPPLAEAICRQMTYIIASRQLGVPLVSYDSSLTHPGLLTASVELLGHLDRVPVCERIPDMPRLLPPVLRSVVLVESRHPDSTGFLVSDRGDGGPLRFPTIELADGEWLFEVTCERLHSDWAVRSPSSSLAFHGHSPSLETLVFYTDVVTDDLFIALNDLPAALLRYGADAIALTYRPLQPGDHARLDPHSRAAFDLHQAHHGDPSASLAATRACVSACLAARFPLLEPALPPRPVVSSASPGHGVRRLADAVCPYGCAREDCDGDWTPSCRLWHQGSSSFCLSGSCDEDSAHDFLCTCRSATSADLSTADPGDPALCSPCDDAPVTDLPPGLTPASPATDPVDSGLIDDSADANPVAPPVDASLGTQPGSLSAAYSQTRKEPLDSPLDAPAEVEPAAAAPLPASSDQPAADKPSDLSLDSPDARIAPPASDTPLGSPAISFSPLRRDDDDGWSRAAAFVSQSQIQDNVPSRSRSASDQLDKLARQRPGDPTRDDIVAILATEPGGPILGIVWGCLRPARLGTSRFEIRRILVARSHRRPVRDHGDVCADAGPPGPPGLSLARRLWQALLQQVSLEHSSARPPAAPHHHGRVGKALAYRTSSPSLCFELENVDCVREHGGMWRRFFNDSAANGPWTVDESIPSLESAPAVQRVEAQLGNPASAVVAVSALGPSSSDDPAPLAPGQATGSDPAESPDASAVVSSLLASFPADAALHGPKSLHSDSSFIPPPLPLSEVLVPAYSRGSLNGQTGSCLVLTDSKCPSKVISHLRAKQRSAFAKSSRCNADHLPPNPQPLSAWALCTCGDLVWVWGSLDVVPQGHAACRNDACAQRAMVLGCGAPGGALPLPWLTDPSRAAAALRLMTDALDGSHRLALDRTTAGLCALRSAALPDPTADRPSRCRTLSPAHSVLSLLARDVDHLLRGSATLKLDAFAIAYARRLVGLVCLELRATIATLAGDHFLVGTAPPVTPSWTAKLLTYPKPTDAPTPPLFEVALTAPGRVTGNEEDPLGDGAIFALNSSSSPPVALFIFALGGKPDRLLCVAVEARPLVNYPGRADDVRLVVSPPPSGKWAEVSSTRTSLLHLDALRALNCVHPDVRRLLFGEAEAALHGPSANDDPAEPPDPCSSWLSDRLSPSSSRLNDTQRRAQQLSRAVAVIHGPPGTGKSFTITCLLRDRLLSTARGLLCGPSNKSVESVLSKLLDEGVEHTLVVGGIRMGPRSRSRTLSSLVAADPAMTAAARHSAFAASSLGHLRVFARHARGLPDGRHTTAIRMQVGIALGDAQRAASTASRLFSATRDSVVCSILRSTRIFVGTCNAVATLTDRLEAAVRAEGVVPSRHLINPDFGALIIDEAGAVLEPDTLLPLLSHARALVLVGDHMQLPPQTAQHPGVASPELSTPLLSRIARLRDLASAQRFSELFDFALLRTQYRMHELLGAAVSGAFYGDRLLSGDQLRPLKYPLVFLDSDTPSVMINKSSANHGDVAIVERLVRHLAAAGVRPIDICCVTFYSAQVQLLHDALDGIAQVATVDSIQGSEYDFVILSCVRTGSHLGFLSSPHRTNVALSRARQLLAIVGCHDSLATLPSWSHYLQFPQRLTCDAFVRSFPRATLLGLARGPAHSSQTPPNRASLGDWALASHSDPPRHPRLYALTDAAERTQSALVCLSTPGLPDDLSRRLLRRPPVSPSCSDLTLLSIAARTLAPSAPYAVVVTSVLCSAVLASQLQPLLSALEEPLSTVARNLAAQGQAAPREPPRKLAAPVALAGKPTGSSAPEPATGHAPPKRPHSPPGSPQLAPLAVGDLVQLLSAVSLGDGERELAADPTVWKVTRGVDDLERSDIRSGADSYQLQMLHNKDGGDGTRCTTRAHRKRIVRCIDIQAGTLAPSTSEPVSEKPRSGQALVSLDPRADTAAASNHSATERGPANPPVGEPSSSGTPPPGSRRQRRLAKLKATRRSTARNVATDAGAQSHPSAKPASEEPRPGQALVSLEAVEGKCAAGPTSVVGAYLALPGVAQLLATPLAPLPALAESSSTDQLDADAKASTTLPVVSPTDKLAEPSPEPDDTSHPSSISPVAAEPALPQPPAVQPRPCPGDRCPTCWAAEVNTPSSPCCRYQGQPVCCLAWRCHAASLPVPHGLVCECSPSMPPPGAPAEHTRSVFVPLAPPMSFTLASAPPQPNTARPGCRSLAEPEFVPLAQPMDFTPTSTTPTPPTSTARPGCRSSAGPEFSDDDGDMAHGHIQCDAAPDASSLNCSQAAGRAKKGEGDGAVPATSDLARQPTKLAQRLQNDSGVSPESAHRTLEIHALMQEASTAAAEAAAANERDAYLSDASTLDDGEHGPTLAELNEKGLFPAPISEALNAVFADKNAPGRHDRDERALPGRRRNTTAAEPCGTPIFAHERTFTDAELADRGLTAAAVERIRRNVRTEASRRGGSLRKYLRAHHRDRLDIIELVTQAQLATAVEDVKRVAAYSALLQDRLVERREANATARSQRQEPTCLLSEDSPRSISLNLRAARLADLEPPSTPTPADEPTRLARPGCSLITHGAPRVTDHGTRGCTPLRLTDCRIVSADGIVGPVIPRLLPDTGGGEGFVGELAMDELESVLSACFTPSVQPGRCGSIAGCGPGTNYITRYVDFTFVHPTSGERFVQIGMPVVRNSSYILLGNQFNTEQGVKYDYRSSSPRISVASSLDADVEVYMDCSCELDDEVDEPAVFLSECPVLPYGFTAAPVIIPARTVVSLPLRLPSGVRNGTTLEMTRITDPLDTRFSDYGLSFINTREVAAAGYVWGNIGNDNDHDITLGEMIPCCIFNLTDSDRPSPEFAVDDVVSSVHISDSVTQGDGAADRQRLLRDLLLQYIRLFRSDLTDSYTHCGQAHIELKKGTTPYRAPPLTRKSPEEEAILSSETRKLLKAGVAFHRDSPFRSNPLLIPKKNGETRYCISYVGVNEQTVMSAYPMPDIARNLSRARGRWHTATDLLSGFWQCELDQESIPVTAFNSPLGLLCFSRMPFGLKNSPAHFSKLGLRVFDGLDARVANLYVDDVLTSSDDYLGHIRDVGSVFRRMLQAGLAVRCNKVQFGYPELLYLGYLVGEYGHRPDPERIKPVLAWRLSTLISKPSVNIPRWLGLLGVYRQHIPRFALLTSVFRDAVKDGVDSRRVLGSLRSLVCFSLLRGLLGLCTVNAIPDFKRPFYILTDASRLVGGAAVLYQLHDDGSPRPVAFWSFTLSVAERRYCSRDLECFTVYGACMHWSWIFGYGLVTVGTDHRSLVWLFETHHAAGTGVEAWSRGLSPFNLVIVWRPSHDEHLRAMDGMSRQCAVTSAPNHMDLMLQHVDLRFSAAIETDQGLAEAEAAVAEPDLCTIWDQPTDPDELLGAGTPPSVCLVTEWAQAFYPGPAVAAPLVSVVVAGLPPPTCAPQRPAAVGSDTGSYRVTWDVPCPSTASVDWLDGQPVQIRVCLSAQLSLSSHAVPSLAQLCGHVSATTPASYSLPAWPSRFDLAPSLRSLTQHTTLVDWLQRLTTGVGPSRAPAVVLCCSHTRPLSNPGDLHASLTELQLRGLHCPASTSLPLSLPVAFAQRSPFGSTLSLRGLVAPRLRARRSASSIGRASFALIHPSRGLLVLVSDGASLLPVGPTGDRSGFRIRTCRAAAVDGLSRHFGSSAGLLIRLLRHRQLHDTVVCGSTRYIVALLDDRPCLWLDKLNDRPQRDLDPRLGLDPDLVAHFEPLCTLGLLSFPVPDDARLAHRLSGSDPRLSARVLPSPAPPERRSAPPSAAPSCFATEAAPELPTDVTGPAAHGPVYIRTDAAYERYCSLVAHDLALGGHERVLAIDLEGRLHRDGFVEQFQLGVHSLSRPSSPFLAVFDTRLFPRCLRRDSPLALWLADPSIVKTFHHGSGDCSALHHLHGLVVQGIYDSAIADSLVRNEHPFSSRGLAIVTLDLTGHIVKKGLEHSRELWERRPLTTELFEYCIDDVAYGCDLYRALRLRTDASFCTELCFALSCDRCDHRPNLRDRRVMLVIHVGAGVGLDSGALLLLNGPSGPDSPAEFPSAPFSVEHPDPLPLEKAGKVPAYLRRPAAALLGSAWSNSTGGAPPPPGVSFRQPPQCIGIGDLIVFVYHTSSLPAALPPRVRAVPLSRLPLSSVASDSLLAAQWACSLHRRRVTRLALRPLPPPVESPATCLVSVNKKQESNQGLLVTDGYYGLFLFAVKDQALWVPCTEARPGELEVDAATRAFELYFGPVLRLAACPRFTAMLHHALSSCSSVTIGVGKRIHICAIPSLRYWWSSFAHAFYWRHATATTELRYPRWVIHLLTDVADLNASPAVRLAAERAALLDCEPPCAAGTDAPAHDRAASFHKPRCEVAEAFIPRPTPPRLREISASTFNIPAQQRVADALLATSEDSLCSPVLPQHRGTVLLTAEPLGPEPGRLPPHGDGRDGKPPCASALVACHAAQLKLRPLAPAAPLRTRLCDRLGAEPPTPSPCNAPGTASGLFRLPPAGTGLGLLGRPFTCDTVDKSLRPAAREPADSSRTLGTWACRSGSGGLVPLAVTLAGLPSTSVLDLPPHRHTIYRLLSLVDGSPAYVNGAGAQLSYRATSRAWYLQVLDGGRLSSASCLGDPFSPLGRGQWRSADGLADGDTAVLPTRLLDGVAPVLPSPEAGQGESRPRGHLPDYVPLLRILVLRRVGRDFQCLVGCTPPSDLLTLPSCPLGGEPRSALTASLTNIPSGCFDHCPPSPPIDELSGSALAVVVNDVDADPLRFQLGDTDWVPVADLLAHFSLLGHSEIVGQISDALRLAGLPAPPPLLARLSLPTAEQLHRSAPPVPPGVCLPTADTEGLPPNSHGCTGFEEVLPTPCPRPANPITPSPAMPSFTPPDKPHARRLPAVGDPPPAELHLDRVRQAQRTDAYFGPVIAYLLARDNGVCTEHPPANCNFYLDHGEFNADGLLCIRPLAHASAPARHARVVCVAALERRVFCVHHDCALHRGQRPTERAVSRQWYMPNLRKKVRSYILCCEACARAKARKLGLGPGETPFRGNAPGQVYTLDIYSVGYECDGYDHIFVIVDDFSGWVRAIPIRGPGNAEELFSIFKYEVIRNESYPVVIKSDRGSPFVSDIWTALCDFCGIKCMPGAAGNHHSAATAERFNRTLWQMLACHRITTFDQRWYAYVIDIEIAFNQGDNGEGDSPFYISRLRDPFFAHDLALYGVDALRARVGELDGLRESYLVPRARAAEAAWDAHQIVQRTHAQRTLLRSAPRGSTDVIYKPGQLVLLHKKTIKGKWGLPCYDEPLLDLIPGH